MTKIEWTRPPGPDGKPKKGETWNPVVGCSPVSEGCRNCYAAKEAIRLQGNPHEAVRAAYAGTSEMRGSGHARRAVFTGVVRTLPDRLEEPLHWTKARGVFVNSMSDLFHRDVPFDFVDQVFAVMALSPQHTFMVLTKRPERMAEYMALRTLRFRWGFHAQRIWWDVLKKEGEPQDPGFPLPNVWLGTSVEDQAAADERIPHLLRTPAAVRFLSCEPLLGRVDLMGFFLIPVADRPAFAAPLDWVIIGGESGPGARRCDTQWIHGLVGQCRDAMVSPFVKQLGEWLKLDDRKGGDPGEWPEELRVREFPAATAVRACRVCGCTDFDCRGCVERTGARCSWVESDLCACVPVGVVG